MPGLMSALKMFAHLGDLTEAELVPADAILDENSFAITDESNAFILDET